MSIQELMSVSRCSRSNFEKHFLSSHEFAASKKYAPDFSEFTNLKIKLFIKLTKSSLDFSFHVIFCIEFFDKQIFQA